MKGEELKAWAAAEHADRCVDIAAAKASNDPGYGLGQAMDRATERRKRAGLSAADASRAVSEHSRMKRYAALSATPPQEADDAPR